jgi:hypothetical protein
VSYSSTGLGRIATGAAFLAAGALWAAAALGADAADPGDKSLAQQIFEAMAQDPGTKPGIGWLMRRESCARERSCHRPARRSFRRPRISSVTPFR